MDKQLLNALNNIGDALELLVDALQNKEEAKSATGTALQSGDFGKQLEAISTEIKSIKADTQTIIKNQQTIIALSKQKESDKKTGEFEGASDPKKESAIKKGVGTILLIAVAVLAIGMAFKLVGAVDVLSVIGLALAITIISIAFAEIAKLNLSWKQSLSTAFALVTIAGALTISSWIMSLIKPVGVAQFATAIFIAATFAVLSIYLDKIFIATGLFDKLRVSKIALFLTLTSISAAITASSWIMSFIKPITIQQGLTAILISGVFSVIGYNLHKIGVAVSLFDKLKVKPTTLIKTLVAISAAIVASSFILQLTMPLSMAQGLTAILISTLFLIISFNMEKIAMGVVAFDKTGVKATDLLLVMVGIAAAITASSFILSFVVPIGLWQFVTALGVTILFAIMSYVLPELAAGIALVGKVLGPKNVYLIPLVMVAISLAIMLSSHILTQTADIEWLMLLKILALGITLAAISLAMSPSMVILGQLDLKSLLKGALAMILVAGVVMVSSHILALGNYEKYPDWKWALGVGLSIISFTPAIVALGLIAMSGVGALAILAGAGMVLAVAGTIVAASHILNKGIYSKYPTLGWSLGVSLALASFATGMVTLGTIIVGTFGLGGVMLAAGSSAVLTVAKAIVATSDILANGFTDSEGKKVTPNWKGGPTLSWSAGVALAIGAFSSVYGMLMANKIMSIFGGGGIGPKEFAEAIKTVSRGIVVAAFELNKGDVWKGGPTKEWAEGVSLAIGAFSPVYAMMMKSELISLLGGSGLDPKSFIDAIKVVSHGIVSAAEFFALNKSKFDGTYPNKEWGEGVGAALGAFSPVFTMLMEKSGIWTSGEEVIGNMVNGIVGISRAIVKVAKIFGGKNVDYSKYPDATWSKGVETTITKFTALAKYLDDNKKVGYWRVTDIANRIIRVARILNGSGDIFGKTIDPNYIKNVGQNMMDFNELVGKLIEAEGNKSILDKLGSATDSLLGTDPISQIARRMITLAEGYDKLASSLLKLGSAMKSLNISDVKQLGGLTSEIVSQTGVTSDNKNIDQLKVSSSPSVTGAELSTKTVLDPQKEMMFQKLDKIVSLLSNIDKSSSSINNFIQGIEDTDVKKTTI